MKIAANVVTHNRKQLLLECLNALINQTHSLDGIYIIDNASTDATPELLQQTGFIDVVVDAHRKPIEIIKTINILSEAKKNKEIEVHYVRMPRNTGSSGGQYEGLKRGYQAGFDWLWLMDDDTISNKDTLKQFLVSDVFLIDRTGLLCSRVLWTNGDDHKGNIPAIETEKLIQYADRGVLPIKSCSFVSCLINRRVIKELGLPIRDFFIWLDDVEYTKRIASNFKAYCITSSVAVHKTEKNENSLEMIRNNPYSIRLFYEIRNRIFLILRSKYLTSRERITFLMRLFRVISISLNHKDFFNIIRTIINGLLFNPKIEKIE